MVLSVVTQVVIKAGFGGQSKASPLIVQPFVVVSVFLAATAVQ